MTEMILIGYDVVEETVETLLRIQSKTARSSPTISASATSLS
jgi:hypothetical protein